MPAEILLVTDLQSSRKLTIETSEPHLPEKKAINQCFSFPSFPFKAVWHICSHRTEEQGFTLKTKYGFQVPRCPFWPNPLCLPILTDSHNSTIIMLAVGEIQVGDPTGLTSLLTGTLRGCTVMMVVVRDCCVQNSRFPNYAKYT